MTTSTPIFVAPHISTPDTGEGVVNFYNTKFWAERGLIHWEDKTTGEYGVLDVEDFKWHLIAIDQMCHNSVREGQHSFYPDQITAHQRFVLAGAKLYDRAREQGCPDDPSAIRDLKRRRPKVFIFETPSANYQGEL